jgi:rhodanese-related sulfurtransferase/rubrerythrin
MPNSAREKTVPQNVIDMQADQARDYMKRHAPEEYTLLDVRQDWEYEEMHLPGAKLLPLSEISERFRELKSEKPTIVYCRAGKRAEAAASYLIGQGFGEVYNVSGGILAWENAVAEGPTTQGFSFFERDKTPEELLLSAYAMEDNLKHFYASAAEGSDDAELTAALGRLSGIEDRHKERLLKVFEKAVGRSLSREEAEAAAQERQDKDALEGGFTLSEFLDGNPGVLEDVYVLLDAAMMFEAQAMDLYSRMTNMVDNEETAALLRALAEEERNHLLVLSKMMDKLAP